MAEHKQTEIVRNAIANTRRKELETYQRAQDMEWLNSRMDDCKMGRCIAQIDTEAQMEKDYQERTDHAAQVNARAAKEIALAKEIASIRDQEFCELNRRHYLRENDPELRELTKKLEAGYVCRDLKMQILSNEYKRQQEKVEELRSCENIEKAFHLHEESVKESKDSDAKKRLEYRNDLRQQLVMNQKLKQCQYEELLREKMLLNDVIKTMYDEDMKELEQKKQSREQLRKEMVETQLAKQQWMQKQKANVFEETLRREKDAATLSDRSAAIITERQKKFEAREEMNEKLSRKIIAEQMERREREDIITNLQQQELLEKYCQDDIQEKEKAMTNMKEAERALKGQMQDHANRDKRDKEDNQMYKQMAEKTMKEGDDKELQKQKSIKERNRRYGEDLKLQIQSNLVKKNKDKEMEDWRNENVFTFNNHMQRETDKESELILKEHIPQLIESRCVPFINSRSLDNLGTDRPHSHPKCNAQCQVLRKF